MEHQAYTFTLTAAQYNTWNRGHWDGYRIEEDMLEHCDGLGLRQPVVVLAPDGVTVAFAITPSRTQGAH